MKHIKPDCEIVGWKSQGVKYTVVQSSHHNVTATHHIHTSHDTELTTESQHRSKHLNQQNRESGSVTFTSELPGSRDTTECCQGARDFLIQTFLNCCWPIRGQYSGEWPMRSQGVLSVALAHSTHPWFIAPSHLIILIRSTMPCCHHQKIWLQKLVFKQL